MLDVPRHAHLRDRGRCTVAYPSSCSSVTRVTAAGTPVTGRSWPGPLEQRAATEIRT